MITTIATTMEAARAATTTDIVVVVIIFFSFSSVCYGLNNGTVSTLQTVLKCLPVSHKIKLEVHIVS
jgi:hypothetical protein